MIDFQCGNCGQTVTAADRTRISTGQRDHCPFCLWSKHLDNLPGDRLANCGGLMQPIGLSLKKIHGVSSGEPMIVYRCIKCGRIHKNRIAGDDRETTLIAIYRQSLKSNFKSTSISLLDQSAAALFLTRLFGKDHIPPDLLKEFKINGG